MNIATHSHKNIPLANSLISAGPAYEIDDSYELLDLNYLVTNGREGYVAFRVTGDSDVPEIHPGYVVFVDTWCTEPRNGQKIAVTINGLTCIKRFQSTNNGLYLVSGNSAYKPRRVSAADNMHILGVVRGHVAIYR